MKKIITGMAAAALVVTIGATTAFAATHNSNAAQNRFKAGNNYSSSQRENYTDSDNNGICDNRNGNGYGNCDENGNCGNYVDEDNDGVCDNRGNNDKPVRSHCYKSDGSRHCGNNVRRGCHHGECNR